MINFLKTTVGTSDELDLKYTTETIKRNAIQGVVVLSGKKIALQLIQTFSTIVLARILFPQTFGIFAIMVFVIEFLATLPSQGFVSAIIQKNAKVFQKDLSTIFWGVMFVSLIFYILLWFLTPAITDFYKFNNVNSVYLFRVMALVIFLVNIRMISSSILERQIRYLPITLIEIVELLITQLVSIFMAIRGFGIESLVVGYISGKSVGALTFYIFSPFKVMTTFAQKNFSKFFYFAMSFQIYSLANSVSGSIAPLYVGHVVGPVGTGYLTWAGGVGLIPWAFAELIAKVSFPVFSRISGNKKLLSSSIDQSLNLILMVVIPVAVILFIFAEPITNIIFTYKWLPAVWALRYFVLLGSTVAITTIAASALMATGQIKFVRNVSLISALVFWILALILVQKIGFIGHPLAWFLGSTIQLVLIAKIVGTFGVRYWNNVVFYLSVSIICAVSAFYLTGQIRNILELILGVGLAFLFYSLLILLLRRTYIFVYLHQFKAIFK